MDETALHWCALAEDTGVAVGMIDCLCDLGAKVDLQSSTNRTALHWAVDASNVAVAKKLVERCCSYIHDNTYIHT